MSRFSGPQHKGALKELKARRHTEAVVRNAMYDKIYEERARVEAEWNREKLGPTPTERLLLAIFGIAGFADDPALDSGTFGRIDPETGDISYLGGTLVQGVDF